MNELRLKDGRVVTVRRLGRGDRGKLQAFDRGLSERSRHYFPPHAYDDATVDKVIERNARGDDVIFVAEHAGEIVAYFFLWHAKLPVPTLGIGLTDRFQGAGLGRLAMETLIDAARGLGAHGIELTTALDNERAFALYQKCGFEYVSDVENILGDGNMRIERCMFLPLKEGAQPTGESHAPPV